MTDNPYTKPPLPDRIANPPRRAPRKARREMLLAIRDPHTGQATRVMTGRDYERQQREAEHRAAVAQGLAQPVARKTPRNPRAGKLAPFTRSKDSPYYTPPQGRPKRASFLEHFGLDALADYVRALGRDGFAIPPTPPPPGKEFETTVAMTPAIPTAAMDAEIRRVAAERGITYEEALPFFYAMLGTAETTGPDETGAYTHAFRPGVEDADGD
jgi:hypothetical protein